MKFMSGQNRERGKISPSPLFGPTFVQFRIVEWSNDINESKERRSRRRKLFPFWRPTFLSSREPSADNRKLEKKIKAIKVEAKGQAILVTS